MKELDNLAKAISILKPAFDAGLEFTVSMTKDKYYIDLDTRGKSECKLNLSGDKIIAEMRYNETKEIEDFDDILSAVQSCIQGRDYFNGTWIRILKENDFTI